MEFANLIVFPAPRECMRAAAYVQTRICELAFNRPPGMSQIPRTPAAPAPGGETQSRFWCIPFSVYTMFVFLMGLMVYTNLVCTFGVYV